MSNLAVSTQEERSFLDRVVDHGVDHALLSEERKQILVDSCDAVHAEFCARLGLNQWDAGQTLQAAELAVNLLSIALEEKSLGDVTLALKALKDQLPGKLIMEKLNFVEKSWLRLLDLAKNSYIGQTRFGYSVRVCKIRDRTGGTSHALFFSFRDDPFLDSKFRQKELLRVLGALKDWAVYKLWLDDLQDVEYEAEVSNKYLPWDNITQQNVFSGKGREIELAMTWNPTTLLATMAAVFSAGGSEFMAGISWKGRSLSFGTIFPASNLDFLRSSLRQRPDVIRAKSLDRFEGYLNMKARCSDIRAEAYLLEMMKEAVDSLLAKPIPAKSDVFSWSLRIHVMMDKQQVNAISAPMYKDREFVQHKSRAERIIEAVEDGKPTHSLKRMLKNLNWSKSADEGFLEDLFTYLEPDMVMEFMPHLPELVDRLCGFWTSRMGRMVWKDNERFKLAKSLIEAGSDEFWRTLHEDSHRALAEAYPTRREEILDKIP